MIIGETRVDHSLDQAKLGKRPALRQRRRTENRLIRQVAEALKPMALAAEVTQLQGRGTRELPLDIRLVLNNVWRLAVIVMHQRQRLIDADQRRAYATRVISQGQDGVLPGEVVIALGNRETPNEVAAHVENGIADVLREKYAGPEAQGHRRSR